MILEVTPRLVELTYEAALKSYWRKNGLRKFLRASKVSGSFISTWDEGESKRDFLDRLFQKLQGLDGGKVVISQMSKDLSEQTTFPDLRNWEDSEQKIQAAQKTVQELKSYIKKQESNFETEQSRKMAQEQARIRKQNIQRSLTDKSKLQQKLDALYSEVGTQDGGYKFEAWFYDLLDFCEIKSRKPYKSDGRQIDGSLTLDGTTYLVELKFTKKQSGATDIDSLKAKVNKMADNTMGIMLSISGYSTVATRDASGSKSTLLILDASHLYLFLSGALSFSEIILIISIIFFVGANTGGTGLPKSLNNFVKNDFHVIFPSAISSNSFSMFEVNL